MSEVRRRRSVSQTRLLDLVATQLDARRSERRTDTVDVVDVGGGTGGLAIALAGRGCRVVVVDPSLDALASLQRRTDEAGAGDAVRGVQGEAADVPAVVGPAGVDVVVCHRVLEVLDDPVAALRQMASVLRPGGLLSLAVAQRRAQVLSHALAGHLDQARRTWADPHRLDHDEVVDLVGRAGLVVLATDGVGAVAELVPEAVVESEVGVYADLLALEVEVSRDPAFRALAPVVHVLARAAD